MSTVSLLPLNQRIAIKKEFKVDSGGFLGDGSEVMKRCGLLNDYSITLEEGVEITIVGFTGNLSDKAWPACKIKFHPPDSKQAIGYVNLGNLDGLSWEPTTNPLEKRKKSTTRLTFHMETNEYRWCFRSFNHSAFAERTYTEKDAPIIAQNLEPKQFKSGGFYVTQAQNIGYASFKDGRNWTNYNISVVREGTFKITKHQGYSTASLTGSKWGVKIEHKGANRTDAKKIDPVWIGLSDLGLESTPVEITLSSNVRENIRKRVRKRIKGLHETKLVEAHS